MIPTALYVLETRRAGDRARTGDVQLGKPRGYYSGSLYPLQITSSIASVALFMPRKSENSERRGHSWALVGTRHKRWACTSSPDDDSAAIAGRRRPKKPEHALIEIVRHL